MLRLLELFEYILDEKFDNTNREIADFESMFLDTFGYIISHLQYVKYIVDKLSDEQTKMEAIQKTREVMKVFFEQLGIDADVENSVEMYLNGEFVNFNDGENRYRVLDEQELNHIRQHLVVEYLLKQLNKDLEDLNLYIGNRLKEMGIQFVTIDSTDDNLGDLDVEPFDDEDDENIDE